MQSGLSFCEVSKSALPQIPFLTWQGGLSGLRNTLIFTLSGDEPACSLYLPPPNLRESRSCLQRLAAVPSSPRNLPSTREPRGSPRILKWQGDKSQSSARAEIVVCQLSIVTFAESNVFPKMRVSSGRLQNLGTFGAAAFGRLKWHVLVTNPTTRTKKHVNFRSRCIRFIFR